MPRPIWKGHVSFGLVNVPITLYSAEVRNDLSFKLIDSRNAARVRYERVNEETGEEVPWNQIVKGYEYEGGNYVLLSHEEMKRVSVELTRTIEIEQFVDRESIDSKYFDKPYVLLAGPKGDKAYALLREGLRNTGKAGIAKVVIRARQHLSALFAEGDALILNLLRFQQELRDFGEFEFPGDDFRKLKITKKEVSMAEKLIEAMAGDWAPGEYEDDYRQALMKYIEEKVAAGEMAAVKELEEPEEEEEAPDTINFMELLQKSVKQGGKPKKGRSRRAG